MNYQATHQIAKEELTRWLDEHGLDIQHVTEANIRIGWSSGSPQVVSAWLDVAWWKLDVHGNRYYDQNAKEAAKGHASVPLSSWPALEEL